MNLKNVKGEPATECVCSGLTLLFLIARSVAAQSSCQSLIEGLYQSSSSAP